MKHATPTHWIPIALERSDDLVVRYFSLCQKLAENERATPTSDLFTPHEMFTLSSSVTERYLKLQELSIARHGYGSDTIIRPEALHALQPTVLPVAPPPRTRVREVPAINAPAAESVADWHEFLFAQVRAITGFADEQIDLDKPLPELGIDSLALISIVEKAVARDASLESRAVEFVLVKTLRQGLTLLERGAPTRERAASVQEPQPTLQAEQPTVARELLGAVARAAGVHDDASLPQKSWRQELQLSTSSLRHILSGLAARYPSVKFAGEQLLSCSTCAEMLELLRGIEGSRATPELIAHANGTCVDVVWDLHVPSSVP